MIIRFVKNQEKPNTIICQRSDGSSSFAKLYSGLEIHDLAHYVVESELNMTTAFYGLVARGFDIEDFGMDRELRPKELLPSGLSDQALQAEHIVNLLQVEFSEPGNAFNFIDTLRAILLEKGIRFPQALNEESLGRIRARLKELMTQWNSLPYGSGIQLSFAN